MNVETETNITEIFNSEEGKNLWKYCNEYTLWDILGMFRYEDAHTNFLASFLDAKKDIFHLDTKPILKFINFICEKDKQYYKSKIKGDFSNIGNLKKDDIKINVRQCYKTSKYRPDILIEIKKKYLILLEAKLEAKESGENQCLDYYNEVEKDYDNAIFIYLSLSNGDKISAEKHYIKITFQDLIYNLYEPFEENNFLTQYLKGFIALVKNEYISNNFKMPIPSNLEKIVNKMYFNNQNVIEDFIKKDKKMGKLEIEKEIFFIVLYKILKDRQKNDLADLIFKNYHRIGIVLHDKKDNQTISKLGMIMRHLIEKLLNNGYSIEDIKNLSDDKYKYLFEEKEFIYQNFTENQKKYYTDFNWNGKSYKILSSYYYWEVLNFLEILKNQNIKLKDIVIKGKDNDNILYPKD